MDSSDFLNLRRKNYFYWVLYCWMIKEKRKTQRKKKKTKKPRFSVREMFLQRERQGMFSNLLGELQLGDREYYFK